MPVAEVIMVAPAATEAVTPAPVVQETTPAPVAEIQQLPQTASQLPLIVLLGLGFTRRSACSQGLLELRLIQIHNETPVCRGLDSSSSTRGARRFASDIDHSTDNPALLIAATHLLLFCSCVACR